MKRASCVHNAPAAMIPSERYQNGQKSTKTLQNIAKQFILDDVNCGTVGLHQEATSHQAVWPHTASCQPLGSILSDLWKSLSSLLCLVDLS